MIRTAKVVVQCQVCGKDIHTTQNRIDNGHGKTCSKKCRHIYLGRNNSGENSVRWKGGPETRICPICDKEFQVNKLSVQRYCSRKCFSEFYSKTYVGENNKFHKPKIEVTCEYCGKSVFRDEAQFKKNDKFFCDNACHWEWNKIYRSGINHPSFKGNVINYHGYHITFENIKNQNKVRELFHNKCIICGSDKRHNGNEDMCIHHIYEAQRQLPFEDGKYVCLCRACHARIHHKQSEWDYWTPYFIELIENYMGGVCWIDVLPNSVNYIYDHDQ